jgi:hypothetical protein
MPDPREARVDRESLGTNVEGPSRGPLVTSPTGGVP